MVVYNELPQVVDELIQKVGRLETRIAELEAGQSSKPGRKPDELAISILEFLRKHPGLKFNSGSITSNIGHHDTKIVSGRLKTMFGRGLIKAEKKDSLSAMYWYEEKEEDQS